MRRHASGSRGYVRVFANISAIVEFLPGALASFSAAHPDIHVHLEEHVSSAIAAAVADNSADFGIVSELPVIDGLTTVPFRNDELVVDAASRIIRSRTASRWPSPTSPTSRSSACMPAAPCTAC